MAATAADIPEELFKSILSYLTSHFDPESSTPQPSIKRILSACSLTCRYWASIARANVFHNITLRSAKDMDVLVSFVRDPDSIVGLYVRGIVIQQSGEAEVPWTHKVYAKLQYFKHLEKVHHKILVGTTYLDSTVPEHALRSVHQGLPRSLPSNYYRCSTLHLSNLRFMDLADLITLVGEMNCENVELFHVSWLLCHENPPRILRKTKRILHTRIRTYSSKDVLPWKFFWLCITTKEPLTPEIGQYVPFIDVQELAPVELLLRWVLSGHLSESPEDERLGDACDSMEITTSFGFREFILRITCKEEKRCCPDYELYFLNGMIVKIRVIYSEGSQERPITEYKWQELDSLTEWFINLQRVIITAHTNSSSLHKHENSISGRMERLNNEKKIMFRTMDRVTVNSRWN